MLLVAFALVFLLSFLVWKLQSRRDYYDAEVYLLVSIFAGAVFFVSLIIWPTAYASDVSNVEAFKAAKETVQHLRTQQTSDVERVMLSQDIVNHNRWLAKAQYWNDNIWADIFIPDSVEGLTPIR
jgi:predicted PurR-regulated permease PerM